MQSIQDAIPIGIIINKEERNEKFTKIHAETGK